MNSFSTLELRMNSENRWAALNNYFQLMVSDRAPKEKRPDLNKEITLLLNSMRRLNPDNTIDWSGEQEITENTFREFALHRITHSMAYDSELMQHDNAVGYLNEFIGYFNDDKQFFTNYDDLEELIKEDGTLPLWRKGYGSSPISDNVFSCALIVVDATRIGAIVMKDDD